MFFFSFKMKGSPPISKNYEVYMISCLLIFHNLIKSSYIEIMTKSLYPPMNDRWLVSYIVSIFSDLDSLK